MRSKRSTSKRGATPHHHPLPVEGRPQPTCLRSVARTARKPPRPARKAIPTAMPAAPAVYCSAARASQLRLRVAPGSGQPAAPSALRGGRTRRLRRLSLAALRIHSLRSGHGLTGGRRAQAGSVPRGGAHSATAGGLLLSRSRSRVVVGCGIRSRPPRRAPARAPEGSWATPWRPRRRHPAEGRVRHPGAPRCSRRDGAQGRPARDPDLERPRRQTAPQPSPGRP